MPKKRTKLDEFLKKSEILLLIRNEIRNIQMLDYGHDEGIPQLWNVYRKIEEMEGKIEIV